MPTSEHPLLALLDVVAERHREHDAHHRSFKDTVMNYLKDLIAAGAALTAERDDLKSDRDAQKARAEAAEKERDDLKAEKAADEASASEALGRLGVEVEAEKPVTTSAEPVTTTTPSGATVTVDPAAGTTTHVDPVANITTTVDHASGAATAIDTSISPAQPVEPAPAVVAEANAATAEAGVTVPAQG